MPHKFILDELPPTGYLRLPQIIGKPAVTEEQARRNRECGRGPKRASAGCLALVPFSSATLWRKVRSGDFPAPVKLSERITAWRVEDITAWLQQQLGA